MKKKQQQHQQQKHGKDGKEHELEITKAVAQAWYGRSTSSKSSSTTEFDTPRLRNFTIKPSRFKIEAMRKAALVSSSRSVCENGSSCSRTTWDFSQSLWDSYEIVAISKRLERGLALDYTFTSEDDEVRFNGFFKKKKESKNSLRNLLNKMSSRRFNEPILPEVEGNEFH